MTEMYQENELKLHRYGRRQILREMLAGLKLRIVYNVGARPQNAHSGGEGTRAEGREVAQSGQKHCLGHGGAQQLQVIAIAA